jgi:hypothetical protein
MNKKASPETKWTVRFALHLTQGGAPGHRHLGEMVNVDS